MQPFAENLILSVVLLALLLGFALRAVRGEPARRGRGARYRRRVAALLRVMEIVLGWVIRLVPIAVFGVVAKIVAEHGFAPLKGLGVYVGVGLLRHGAAHRDHVSAVARTRRAAVAAALLARGEGAGDLRGGRQQQPGDAAAHGARARSPGRVASVVDAGRVVGTNLNNDGIILYEGMAVLFVAQAHGVHLGLGQQLLAAGACLVAAMGVAGVPEAGFISLALVLNTVGLPVDILPLLLTVDWILGRARSVTNVLSDMVLSIMIDRGRKPAPEPAPHI